MSTNSIGDLLGGILARVEPIADTDAARIAADQRRREIQGKREGLEKAGIPARILDALASGKALRQTAALERVTAWLASDSQDLLVLSGGVGCGKTFAAAWACTQSRWPVFCDPLTLATIRRFEGQFNAEDLAPLANCSLLVLDDLAAEFAGEKGSTLELVEALLTRRQARGLRTLVTTNAERAEFLRRYGTRIESRLRESGAFFSCGGDDLRRGAQQAKAVG